MKPVNRRVIWIAVCLMAAALSVVPVLAESGPVSVEVDKPVGADSEYPVLDRAPTIDPNTGIATDPQSYAVATSQTDGRRPRIPPWAWYLVAVVCLSFGLPALIPPKPRSGRMGTRGDGYGVGSPLPGSPGAGVTDAPQRTDSSGWLKAWPVGADAFPAPSLPVDVDGQPVIVADQATIDRLRSAGFTDLAIAYYSTKQPLGDVVTYVLDDPRETPESLAATVAEMNTTARRIYDGSAQREQASVDRAFSMITSMIPGIGDAKDAQEAISGVDVVSGDRLSTRDRLLTLGAMMVPVVGGSMVRQGAKHADDAVRLAEKALTKGDEVADAASAATRLIPGTAEHKAARWSTYQAQGGEWTYERWSKQYDTNMRNVTEGLKREREYRAVLGGDSRMIQVDFPDGSIGWRQVDIYRKGYAGQLKTGYEYLTQANIEAIKRDEILVSRGLQVEWILEQGGSKPLLAELKRAGIDVHIGPLIPYQP